MIPELMAQGTAPVIPAMPGTAPTAPDLPFGTTPEALAAAPIVQEEIDWGDLQENLALELSPELEAQLVADVLSQIFAAEDARGPYLDTIKKVRNRYYLETPDRKPFFKQGANFHVPFMRWQMDALGARILGAAIQQPIIGVTGVRGSGDVTKAARMEPFLEWINREQFHLPMTADEMIERVQTDGVLFVKVPWRHQVRKVRRRRMIEERLLVADEATGLPLLGEGNQPQVKLIRRMGITEEEEPVYHGPALELVTVDHFIAPNPHEATLEAQPWLAQEFWLTRQQLWDERERMVVQDGREIGVGLYRNVREVLKSAAFIDRESTSRGGLEAEFNAREGVHTEIVGTALVGEIRAYEIIWPYRTWRMALDPDLTDAQIEALPSRVLLVIAPEEQALIRAIRYPFWDPEPETMWVKVFLIQKQGRLYNPSIGELLMVIQDEIDTIHWQRSDATTVLILSFLTFLAEEGAADDLDRIILGAKNVVSNIAGIKLLADVVRTGLQAPGLDVEQIVLKFGELLMSIAQPQLGVQSAGGTTATEITTLVREGSLKFGPMLLRFGESLVQCDRRAIRRYQQFYPLVAPLLVRLRGEDPLGIEELALEDLQTNVDLQLRGATVGVNKELEAAKAFRLLQLSETNIWMRALLMAHPEGVYELIATTLQQTDWPGGPEVLIGKKENALKVLQGVIQFMMSAQAQAGARGAPGAPGAGGGDGSSPATLRSPIAETLNNSGMTAELANVLSRPSQR